MGLSQGGQGEEDERERERESHLPAPGSAVRQLPAVLEMPRDGEQSQAGLEASASPNLSPLFKQ